MSVNFLKIFNSAAQDISYKLASAKTKEEQRIKDEFFSSGDKEAIQKQMIANERKIDLIKKENDKLSDDLKNLDPKCTYEEKQEFDELGGRTSYYATKSCLLVAREIKGSAFETNIVEFEKIRIKFQRMFELAVGGKEQREILFRFYSINWSELGIELPPDIDLSKVSIENGVITSGIKLLD